MNEEKKAKDLLSGQIYKGILSSWTFVEDGFGMVRRDLFNSTWTGISARQCIIKDLASQHQNTLTATVVDNVRRFDGLAKITTIGIDGSAPRDFTAGLEYYAVSSDLHGGFHGPERGTFPANGSRRIPVRFRNLAGLPILGVTAGLLRLRPFDLSILPGHRVFAKDKVSFDRFTLLAGLRTKTLPASPTQGVKPCGAGPVWFLSARLPLRRSDQGRPEHPQVGHLGAVFFRHVLDNGTRFFTTAWSRPTAFTDGRAGIAE
jgi:hypothetical protein